MGKINDVVKIANAILGAFPVDAKKSEETLGSIGHTEDDLRRQLKRMTDDELVAAYVPDVYQKDIYSIDYEKLKDHGIKLISFDIDDTIAALGAGTPPDSVKLLFRDLRMIGITVVLLTNNTDEKGKSFAEKLGVDYIAGAKKPYSIGFKAVLFDYEERYHEKLEKSEMAHVGNHLIKDIKGGNIFGITTCLVRRVGTWGHIGAEIQKLAGVNESHIVREELKERGIWYRHHQYEKGDQYYQLGEDPGYKMSDKTDFDIAMQTAKKLAQTINAGKEKAFELDELLRNAYEKKNDDAIKTLDAHMGKNVILTGTWNMRLDMRKLEENELKDGEISACVFTVGNYQVRMADCLYKDSDGVSYTERKPAGKDVIASFKKYAKKYDEEYDEECNEECNEECDEGYDDTKYRYACEISAKYVGENGASPDGWHHVCFRDVSMAWSEDINFICAVKSADTSSNSHEALFILKKYMGSAFGVEHWYRFTSDGAVKEYELHPLDPDSDPEPWELSDAFGKETGSVI